MEDRRCRCVVLGPLSFPSCCWAPAPGRTAAVAPLARRYVHRAGRDDPRARRRAAPHEIFTPKDQAGAAAAHPAAHAVRHRGLGRQRSRAYFKELADDGYIFVFQDIRGKFGSEGTFVMQRPPRRPGDTKAIDEGTDTYDTIDWLLKNVPQHNGRVGMLGISYAGWTTVMARSTRTRR